MAGRKKVEIDMEKVYKLKEQYKTNEEIAKIFTKKGVKVCGDTIRRNLKLKPYPIWEKENFKQMKLEGFECFWVSEDGDIFNTKTQNFLKPCLKKNGYYQTVLVNNQIKFKHRMLNQIVYCVWNDIYDLSDKEIHHIDENKTNNNIDNLELAPKKHGKNYNNTKVVNDNIDKIINEYKRGLSSIKIAKKWDVSKKFILKMLKDNGVKLRPKIKELPICLIALWRDESMTYKEITNKLREKCNIKTNKGTVRIRLKEYYENIPNNN